MISSSTNTGPQYLITPSAPALDDMIPPPFYTDLYPDYSKVAATPLNLHLPQGQPLLTQAIHQQTVELLSKAIEQVDLILDRKTVRPLSYQPQAAQHNMPVAQSLMPPVFIDNSDRSWRMFNNETHVHHHHQESSEKENDQTGLRIFVGFVGLAAALATAFFIGQSVAAGEDTEDETLSFDQLKSQWKINKSCYDNNYRTTVKGIIAKVEAIFKRNETNRIHKIALLVFAFIASGTAFAGAVAGSKLLMGAGLVFGACTAAGALYKLGYTYFSKREKKDAEAIDRALYQLNSMQLVIHP